MALTKAEEQAWVEAFLEIEGDPSQVDLSDAQRHVEAYRRAFPDRCHGRSKKQIAKRAYYIAKKASVQEEINHLRHEIAERTELKGVEIIERLQVIADFDPLELLEGDGEGGLRLKPLDQIPRRLRVGISRISIGRKGVLVIECADKIKANQLLGQYAQLWQRKGDAVGEVHLHINS